MKESNGVTYAQAGVDIATGEAVVEDIKNAVRSTYRSEVVGDLGGFAGLVKLDMSRYRSPLLASSTDGVGTKLAIARQMGVHDTIGIDLVAMVVDDLVVCGAEPLFLLDYIACGRIDRDVISSIVTGIAEGCRIAGCALVGGETAEHPGVMAPEDYDVSATGVGIVESDEVLGAQRVNVGDVLIALGSSGLHSNGFSLVRHVLFTHAGLNMKDPLPELDSGRPLGMDLLVPTRIYAKDCLALIAAGGVHAFAHVTGGGIASNLARVLPQTVNAVVDRGSWNPAHVFGAIAERGNVSQHDMENTLNMGIGMVAVVSSEKAEQALELLRGREVPAWIAGEVVAGEGEAALVGKYSS